MQKIISTLISAAFCGAVCMAQGVQLAAGRSQCLFVTDSSSQYPYRIPAIAQAKDGTLIAVSDYRPCGMDIGYGRVDIMARVSEDNGLTWGKMVTVGLGSGVKGAIGCGFGDAALVADRGSQEAVIFCVCGNTPYFYASRENPNRVARFRSHDGGRTWGDFEEVTEGIYSLFDKSKLGPVKSLFFGSGKICQSRFVKVGKYYRLYAALAARDGGNRVIYSDDFGDTWHALGSIDVSPVPKGDEPKCEELPNGNVVISSRTWGGRYFNIFAFTDLKKATGKWGEVYMSDANCNGVVAKDNACNGEMLIVPARCNVDGRKTYLALQSVPFGAGRSNVGIYVKEITARDMVSPMALASNWIGKFPVSTMESAYSTMTLQHDGNVAFFYEETTYGREYTNVFRQLSIEEITGGKYSYCKSVSAKKFVKACALK